MGFAPLARPGLTMTRPRSGNDSVWTCRVGVAAPLRWLVLVGCLLSFLLPHELGRAETSAAPTVVVAVGAPGEEEYGRQFAAWADQWRTLAQHAGAHCFAIGLGPTNAVTDREQLDRALAELPRESAQELWLVLLGHGTFDGQDAKFNLRGPDLSAAQLASWLSSFRRPLAVINCASSSGPFLPALSGTNRAIVTATQSGYEQNYTRFGQYFIEALADLSADLDKDGQVSLLEAFLIGSRRVGEFYETDGRLATEHALLDDNGDGKGTPAEWFRGVRVVRKADNAVADGLRAHQVHLVRSARELAMPAALRAQRDQLELALEQLRARKSELSEADYYRRLEALLLDLGKIYQASGQLDGLQPLRAPEAPAESEPLPQPAPGETRK
jgi:hypothetical protein